MQNHSDQDKYRLYLLLWCMCLLLGCEQPHPGYLLPQQGDQAFSTLRYQTKNFFSLEYDYICQHFPVVQLPFEFHTDSLFEGMNFKPQQLIPNGKHIHDTLIGHWFADTKKLDDQLTHIAYPAHMDIEAGRPPMNDSNYGFRFKTGAIEAFVFYNYEWFSATNGGFWQVWLALYNDKRRLVKIQTIGVDGAFDESGWVENENEAYYYYDMDCCYSIINIGDDGIQTSVYRYNEYHKSDAMTDKEFTRVTRYPTLKFVYEYNE